MRHYLDKHPDAALPEHVKNEFNQETLNQTKHEELIAAAAKVNGTEIQHSELGRGDTEVSRENNYLSFNIVFKN